MLMRNLLTAGPEVLSPLWGWLHTRSTGYGGRPQNRTPTWGFGRDGTGYSACSARFDAYLRPRVATAFFSCSPIASRRSASDASTAALIAAIRLPSGASSGGATARASASETP